MFIRFDGCCKREFPFDAQASFFTVSATALRRISGLDQSVTKGVRVTWWDKPAGLAGQDQIFGSLDGRSDHGEAGSHCL